MGYADSLPEIFKGDEFQHLSIPTKSELHCIHTRDGAHNTSCTICRPFSSTKWDSPTTPTHVWETEAMSSTADLSTLGLA